jgi:hypothetical protein
LVAHLFVDRGGNGGSRDTVIWLGVKG